MATAYFAKQERDVTLKESRQSSPMSDGLFDEAMDIVMALVEFTFKQKVKAIEFFKIHQDTHIMFIKFSHDMRGTYIDEVTNTN